MRTPFNESVEVSKRSGGFGQSRRGGGACGDAGGHARGGGSVRPSPQTSGPQKNGRAAAEMGCFLMHQANQNLIVRIAEALGVSAEKFYSNIRRYGNTSSASMLIAAAEWQREKGFQTGAPIVFGTFGAGFHWGALLAD